MQSVKKRYYADNNEFNCYSLDMMGESYIQVKKKLLLPDDEDWEMMEGNIAMVEALYKTFNIRVTPEIYETIRYKEEWEYEDTTKLKDLRWL